MGMVNDGSGLGSGLDRYERLVVFFLAEYNCTVYQSEEGMVFTDAYVFARIVTGAALAYDDVACDGRLTTEYFHAEALAV